MTERPTIFVSGVSSEFRTFRQAVRDVLLAKDIFPVVQDSFPPDYRQVRQMLTEHISKSDAVICLVGFTYGAEPHNRPESEARRSYTQLEYHLARELNKPTFVFLSDEKTRPCDDPPVEDAGRQSLQRAHRAAVVSGDELWHVFEARDQLLTFIAEIPIVAQAGFRISSGRLRHGAQQELVGREKELGDLDKAWDDPKTHVVTIVAWGGVGKTALVVEWMARMASDDWRRAERVFDWSFYSQGTREQGAASADTFVAAALEFFGGEEGRQLAASPTSPWDKGAKLAQLVGGRRALLVLDGVEPLQYPPGPVGGKLKDPALEALLKGLALHNAGLCIVTTRESATDLKPYRDTTAPEWLLGHLSEEAGAQLLFDAGVKRAGKAEIRPADKELKDASRQVDGHALTLRLLGNHLRLAYHGDIRKRNVVAFEEADAQFKTNPADADKPYGHAFTVMASCERWLGMGGEEGKRQLAVLHLLGLFDRPADAGCLAALRKDPVIPGLTDSLVGLSDGQWNTTIARLEECGIVCPRAGQSSIDCHPLVRQYFAKQLREKNPDACRAAHRRLYEHLCASTPDKPQPTLEDLQPLYQAVAHGCQAGITEEAQEKVFNGRIQQGRHRYSFYRLGAFGSGLGAIACAFKQPWSELLAGVSEDGEAWLLSEAAFCLRALGRLTEALEPLRAGLKNYTERGEWQGAAIDAGNLSELDLTLGEVAAAVADAEHSITYADRSGHSNWSIHMRCRFADTLHQAGRRLEAQMRFYEAEQLEAKVDPNRPLLSLLSGFLYCDLLLATSERAAWQTSQKLEVTSDKSELLKACRAVSQRAAQTLKWTEQGEGVLLSIALDHLTLGRAALYEAILTNSAFSIQNSELNQAVDGLRRAGEEDFLPRGLLTQAWLRFLEGHAVGARADLDEAWEIAERGSMKLHMADIHLYRARLFGSVKYPWESPQADLAAARKLIEQCGYGRRKEELEDAEEAIGTSPKLENGF
jgi:tetratricopeptide (TPR) repeat protein